MTLVNRYSIRTGRYSAYPTMAFGDCRYNLYVSAIGVLLLRLLPLPRLCQAHSNVELFIRCSLLYALGFNFILFPR